MRKVLGFICTRVSCFAEKKLKGSILIDSYIFIFSSIIYNNHISIKSDLCWCFIRFKCKYLINGKFWSLFSFFRKWHCCAPFPIHGFINRPKLCFILQFTWRDSIRLLNALKLELKVYCDQDKFYGRSKFGVYDKKKNRAPLNFKKLTSCFNVLLLLVDYAYHTKLLLIIINIIKILLMFNQVKKLFFWSNYKNNSTMAELHQKQINA